MEEKPNYYAIIPAFIRYDEELKANEKLLYGEITSLMNKEGYCYASNKYFANLYNVSIQSVSDWINNLIKKGYIESEMIYKENSKKIDYRKITLPILKKSLILKKTLIGIKENFNTGIKENLKVNNKDIIINNNNNSIYDFIETNFGRPLNPIEYEMISKWKDTELTRYAIKQAVLNNKYNIKYINSILRNYELNHITNIQEAQEEEKNFKNRYNKRKIDTPKWLNKEIETNLMDQEEVKELEEDLKEFR